MKNGKALLAVSVLLPFLVFAVLSSPVPVHAAATVSATTLTGSAGTSEWNTVPQGAAVTFSGKATDSSGNPVSGATLYLYSYTGFTVGSPVGSATTASDGSFSITRTFSATGTWTNLMTPCSTWSSTCVSSPFVFTYVYGALGSIALTSSATSASTTVGSTVALVGVARDTGNTGMVGTTVYVFGGPSGGTQSRLSTITTQAGWGGSFVAYVPCNSAGTFTYDASGSSTNSGINSATVTITVAAASSPAPYILKITNPPPSSYTGSSNPYAPVYGELLNPNGTPAGGVSASISLVGPVAGPFSAGIPLSMSTVTTSSTLSQVTLNGQTFSYNFFISLKLNTYATYEIWAQQGTGSNFLETQGYQTTWSATSTTYSMTFSETGLPTGSSWSVAFDGVTQSGTSTSFTFTNVASGTYSWSTATTIAGVTGVRYLASPASGSLSVTGSTAQGIAYSTQYYLTVQSSPSAGGTVSPSSGWYDSGATAQLTASASTGYTFSSWTGSCYGSANPCSVTLSGPMTETASFNPGLTITSGTGGSVSYSYGSTSGSVAAGTSQTIYASTGTSVTFQAVAAAGYSFSGWAGALSGTTNPTSVVVGSPVFVSATFAAPAAVVSFQPTGVGAPSSGTILTVDGVAYSSMSSPLSFIWTTGTAHTFSWSSSVSGSSGVRYAWSAASGLSTAQSGSITVPSTGGSISATYATQYQVTFASSPSAGGTVSPPSGWYNLGSLAIITATSSSGYTFSSWSSSTTSITFASATSASTSATIGGTGNVTVNFAAMTSTVTFSETGQPSGASWSVTFNNGTLSTSGTAIPFSNITPGSYSWSTSSTISCGSGCRIVVTSYKGTLSVPSQTSQTISYTQQYLVTLAVNPLGAGTTSPATGSAIWVDAGGSISLAATPVTGSSFSSWSSSSGSIAVASPLSSSTSATVNDQGILTANFVDPLRSATFGESGLPSGTSWSVTYDGETASSTTATIAFYNVPSGSHSYTIAPASSADCTYNPSPSSGSFDPTITTNLSTVFSLTTCTVVFTEDGLPAGTSWSVTFNSVTLSTSGTFIPFFNIPPGSYSWSTSSTISCGSGCRIVVAPYKGTLSVASQTSQSLAYTQQFQVAFALNPSKSGTISPSAGSNIWVNSGGTISLSATAAAGHAFSSWSSSTSSIVVQAPSSAASIATVAGSGKITANFLASVSLALSPASLSVTAGGTATLSMIVYGAKQQVTLTASGLPAGIALSFASNPITDSVSGTKVSAQIGVSSGVPAGVYNITIVSTGADGERSSSVLTLSVT